MDISEDRINQINENLEVADELTQEEARELAELYDTQILPKKYWNKIDAYISKEDMVVIAERMSKYIESADALIMTGESSRNVLLVVHGKGYNIITPCRRAA
jgi:hypothetical protein